jgi:hypothetical protein
VKLLSVAGFDAHGMEMSPAVISRATEWFGIEVLQGPIEASESSLGAYDMILMFDVVEHLGNPRATLAKVVEHLTEDGVLVVQTPRHAPGLDRSWQMYVAPEHTYLFTVEGLTELLATVGLHNVALEPPFFPTDMFLFASRQPLQRHSADAIASNLMGRPDGRMALTMLDMRQQLCAAREALQDPVGHVGVRTLGRAFWKAVWRRARRLVKAQ